MSGTTSTVESSNTQQQIRTVLRERETVYLDWMRSREREWKRAFNAAVMWASLIKLLPCRCTARSISTYTVLSARISHRPGNGIDERPRQDMSQLYLIMKNLLKFHLLTCNFLLVLSALVNCQNHLCLSFFRMS